MGVTDLVYEAILMLEEADNASYAETDVRLRSAMNLLWAAIDECEEGEYVYNPKWR